MRIALFTETYLPLINGVVTHVKILKEGLESLGHEVLIVTANKGAQSLRRGDVLYCPAVRLKKIYNYDVSSPLSFERLRQLKDFNPDIIHIHNEFGIGLSGVIISKILEIPLVYTLHTMYDEYVYYVAGNRHIRRVITDATHSYARALATTAGAIIGPSPKVEEYFRSCGVKKPVNVIPNPVEVNLFSRDNADGAVVERLRREYGFAREDFVFCFCGRLGQEKNVAWLLDAFAGQIKPDERIKLLIIGGGPLQTEHERQTRELGIADLVKFTGAIEHEQLPEYYACGSAYVTASLSDTNSISMLEGMSMGLPVLSLRDDLNVGQVVDGVNGYAFRDGAEMAEKMRMLQHLPAEEMRALSLSTRDFVSRRGGETLAESVLSIYRTVIHEKKLQRRVRGIRLKTIQSRALRLRSWRREGNDSDL